MGKFRIFILALFGFFLLSVVLYILIEIAWGDRDTAAIVSVPTTAIYKPTSTPEGDPAWLIPVELINFYCDHPWVIRRTISLRDSDIDELIIGAGLSECYHLAGELAIESHLWHQGINILGTESRSMGVQAETVELYFEHSADFQKLGLKMPEWVSVSGRVVHDWNGDAVFNPSEPVISEARICINREPLSPLCVRSGPDGRYSFDDILPGAWNFKIFSPSTKRLDEFKYTNQLIEADYVIPETMINDYTITERYLNLTEFNPIESEILLLVDQDIAHDFFLMHEWATYFAAPEDADFFQTTSYYDLEVRPGLTRVYNGESGMTYDQHDGLDTSCPRGTEIVSVAEGRVIAILYDSTVAIRHTNQLISVYGHGDPIVEENQYVPRGYPIALCNNHLTDSDPHLHFAVWKSTPWLHLVNYGIPPFADLLITEERWVANHHPLEKNHFVYLLLGSRGIWTEINQPHLPYVRILGK